MNELSEPIELLVNGAPVVVAKGVSLAGLIDRLGLDTRKLAVERNREIVPRSQYGATRLDSADEIEIVHFIGGG